MPRVAVGAPAVAELVAAVMGSAAVQGTAATVGLTAAAAAVVVTAAAGAAVAAATAAADRNADQPTLALRHNVSQCAYDPRYTAFGRPCSPQRQAGEEGHGSLKGCRVTLRVG